MEKQIISINEKTPDVTDLVQQASALQTLTGEQMTSVVNRLAELVIVMDSRMSTLESILKQRITVSSAEAKGIAEAVKTRAVQLCEKSGLPYAQVGRFVRDAIWRAFRNEYMIASHYDLPAAYYDLAIQFISGWSSFALIRRLRERVAP